MRRQCAALILGLSLLASACSSLPDNLAFYDPATTDATEEFADLMAFLEAERGLTFLAPVSVRRTDVTAALAESFEARAGDSTDSDEVRDPGSVALTLLGLLDEGSDASEQAATARTEVAGAFYEPATGEIVMPDEPITDAVRALMVHELTHALQHQNDLLIRKMANEDEALVHLALIEGDADRMRDRWIGELPEDRAAALAEEYDEAAIAQEPLRGFAVTQFLALYALGHPTVDSIVEADGLEELNQLLRDGGGSTERLFDPLGSLVGPVRSGEAPAVEDESPGATTIGTGTIGALTFYLSLVATNMTPGEAFQAVIGYDSDTYRVVENEGDGYCLVGTIWVDSGNDGNELAAAFDRSGWTASVSTNGQPGGSAVSYEGCSAMVPVRAQGIELLAPVWVAGWSLNTLLEDGVNPALARCQSQALASSIPVSQDALSQFDRSAVERLAAQPWVAEACLD